MRILVAYGSTRGGTEGLAQWVAEGLRENGLDAEAVPARQARRLDGYGAVVVGGALYASRWHRDARRFVRRHLAGLRECPVWFFSSGPLDDSATHGDIPPVTGVRKLMERCGARGHITFGGRLRADARGFPASAMAKNNSGDWRDAVQVKEWARTIAEALLADGEHR